MRDYGVVRVRFWAWAKRNGLSAEGRVMALYLLTCAHGNSLGCFRLPMAYLCDDLDTTPKVAAKPLEELAAFGFLERDQEGWTWIRDYLDHNPIPNGNVGKAVGKMLEQVPSGAPFYPDLLASLHGLEHFPPNLIDTLRERYLNGSDTVSRGGKTHIHTHTHDPTHEHDSMNSAADAAAGDAKRGTRILDDWKLTPELRGFASDLGLDPDVTREGFVDYWRGVPGARGRKLDWPATFRNRCRDLAGRPAARGSAKPALHTITDENWPVRVKGWLESKFWVPSWGPPPGEPGCFVPKELLQ
jgi:hypothetical protein